MKQRTDGGKHTHPSTIVNQSSFFDEISCDALDGRGRMPRGRNGERTRNTETFGATSVALSAGSRRYGGRGGGGGGYGGYAVRNTSLNVDSFKTSCNLQFTVVLEKRLFGVGLAAFIQLHRKYEIILSIIQCIIQNYAHEVKSDY